MGRRVVAIHQPNFFPWLGFFDKLARADVMVLLDAVQFPKKGGNHANRTRVLMNGSPVWLTVPVDRSHSGTRTIREMTFDPGPGWREKMLKTLASAYGRSPGFEETMPLVESVLERRAGDLADLNTFGVKAVAGAIGLDPGRLVLQSTLDAEGSATDLLVSITKAVGGTAYLAGGGAGGYQEDERFGDAEIELIEQDFEPPPYEQGGGEFVPGLSVVDAMMSLGAAGVGGLLGRRPG